MTVVSSEVMTASHPSNVMSPVGAPTSPSDVIMTSLSPGNVVDSHATRTVCCDVTAVVERETMILKSTSATSASESVVDFTSNTHATVTSSGGVFTGDNGGLSRDYATQLITTDTVRDVTAAWLTTTSTASRQTNKSLLVTLADVNDTSSMSSAVTPRLTGTFTNVSLIDSQTLFTNASRDHRDSRLPLALRSSADNASMSAAVGSNMADRRAGSGLLREEVATVGAAVAGVAVFWSLLAFTMCVIMRMRKRKQRQRMRGSDVDAQTAMMEAMVRAELARGRSRVGDSRIPTYVNVAELIPRSSSSCDLDMSDFFHLVLDNNHSDSHGVWKKQRYNDVIFGRPRDHPARWQDGSKTLQAREVTTHKSNNCPQLNSREDHYCLLNDVANGGNGHSQQQCNGLLTKVQSLDSVCKAADEPAAESTHRQRPRRRRRYGVRRSASTSRCLVMSANNKLASSVNAPANGCHDDVIKPEKEVTVDDDVKCQLPVSDVKQSEDCANQVSRPEVKDELTAVHPTDTTRIPEVVARHGDNMVLPEVSSLGDREPVVMSPLSHQDVFSSRTCALVPRTTQLAHRVGPFHRHVPPYRVMASAVRPPCSDRLPRLLRYPPPPPPPPPLPSHLMRLFATSSDSKSTCSRPSTSLANTGGRPVRFPRMGHTGLATNSSHRMTLQVVRPDHFQL